MGVVVPVVQQGRGQVSISLFECSILVCFGGQGGTFEPRGDMYMYPVPTFEKVFDLEYTHLLCWTI